MVLILGIDLFVDMLALLLRRRKSKDAQDVMVFLQTLPDPSFRSFIVSFGTSILKCMSPMRPSVQFREINGRLKSVALSRLKSEH